MLIRFHITSQRNEARQNRVSQVGGQQMTQTVALIYSFLFGLLHGILPDEHTWPITFSYAIGSSSREGMRAGLYFSAAFTLQRTLLSELAYLALAPFLLSREVNSIVYIVVGAVMIIAGVFVLRFKLYPHLHLFGHCTGSSCDVVQTTHLPEKQETQSKQANLPPVQWTLVHGFIAGFGFGGFSLFVNTVAAPAMRSPWLGFLPGLLFGLGTMIVLVLIGALFGASLHRARSLSEDDIRFIGAQTGGRTLFYGGLLFVALGIVLVIHLDRYLPFDAGYALITVIVIAVAVPSFILSWREVKSRQSRQ